ncbi:hypothetical protein DFH07DRAFT_846319, partial [Mycena maculata]
RSRPAFVATFPDLVEQEVVLLASAGLVEVRHLPRTAKVMSTPIVQTLTANPLIYAYLRRLASRPDTTHEASTAWMHELVPHQSAHLPGFNHWAFESGAWAGRRVLVIHGTTDQTVPPAHAPRIKALIEAASSSSSSFNASKPAQVSVKLIAGVGHALTWTHAEAVGRAVVQFFAGARVVGIR